jgi:hypothetical protein
LDANQRLQIAPVHKYARRDDGAILTDDAVDCPSAEAAKRSGLSR